MPSKKEWIQKLLAKPGDKDLLGLLVLKCGRASCRLIDLSAGQGTMLWHLKQQLVPDEAGLRQTVSTTSLPCCLSLVPVGRTLAYFHGDLKTGPLGALSLQARVPPKSRGLRVLAFGSQVLLVANLASEEGASRASVESFRVRCPDTSRLVYRMCIQDLCSGPVEAFAQQLLLLGKVQRSGSMSF